MSVNRSVSMLLNALSVDAKRKGSEEVGAVLKEASNLVRRVALPGNEDKLAELAKALDSKLAGPEPEALVPEHLSVPEEELVQEEDFLSDLEDELEDES